MKQQIHAFIDSEIYLSLKLNKVNISQTVNNLLRGYVDINDDKASDILKLQDELLKLKKEKDEKINEIGFLAIRIAKAADDKDKEQKEDFANRKLAIESLKRGGVFDDD